MIDVKELPVIISSGMMNVVSFATGENLSVPQYHSKMIFTAFRLLV